MASRISTTPRRDVHFGSAGVPATVEDAAYEYPEKGGEGAAGERFPGSHGKIAAHGRSRRNHHIDDVAGDLCDVSIFHEMKENVFERGLADALANFFGGAAGDNLSFP